MHSSHSENFPKQGVKLATPWWEMKPVPGELSRWCMCMREKGVNRRGDNWGREEGVWGREEYFPEGWVDQEVGDRGEVNGM